MSSTGEEVRIRPATLADAGIIAEFNRRMALETENRHLDPETSLRGAGHGLQQTDQCRYFMVEASDQIIAQAMITYEWSDWRDGMFWWIQSVYVHPDFRRAGIFRRLYDHIAALAQRTPGVCGLRLYVEQHNRDAIETYERLGMQPSGHVVYEQDFSLRRSERLRPGKRGD